VSNGWLRIRPAFCIRLSFEYIGRWKRDGRNSCSGSATKFSATANRMKAALVHRNRTRFFDAVLIRT
jgi:hypothetical protein